MDAAKTVKKALSKTFNTHKPRQTHALALLLATAAAGGAYTALTETPSADRTPVLGQQQYNRLKSDLDAIARLKPEMDAAGKAAAVLQQQVIAAPEKKELENKMWELRFLRDEIERSYDRQREEFRETLLASEGISEKDAIALVAAFEQKVDTETFESVKSGNKLAHLDECQAAPETQDNPYNMPWCLRDASEMPGTPLGTLGAGLLAALMAGGLASVGARFEKELKADGDKAPPQKDKKKKITITLRNN